MARKIAVIGLGKFGSKLAETLYQSGVEVLGIDDKEENIERMQNNVTEIVQVRIADKESLEAAGVKNMDLVVVAIGGADVEANILTTALLKQIGVKEIIARAISPTHYQILKSLGVARIISPEEDMAVRLARSIIYPGVKDYLQLKGPWDIVEIEITGRSKFNGKTIEEIRPQAYNVNILMIERENGKEAGMPAEVVQKFPHGGYRLREGDILVVFGEAKDLEKFESACAG